jgi:cation:H+ antiporter
MAAMLTYVLFIAGFLTLIKGADLLVDGASSLARRLRVSPLLIGLTVVAFGTSAPELAVNMLASSSGNTGLAVGNIVGSNIANLLLIIGAAAVIFPLTVKTSTVWKEIPLSLLAAIVLFFLVNDAWIDGATYSVLSRSDGLVLIGFFAIFLHYLVSMATRQRAEAASEAALGDEQEMSGVRAAVYVVTGLVGLVLGGQWIVNGAVAIATAAQISETVIGLTIVAFGTSLPELAAGISAALKKQSDLVIGSVIGSNIFNVFWVLGISAVIRPLPFDPRFNTDILLDIVANTIIIAFLFIGRKHLFERWQGAVFLTTYVAYIVWSFL